MPACIHHSLSCGGGEGGGGERLGQSTVVCLGKAWTQNTAEIVDTHSGFANVQIVSLSHSLSFSLFSLSLSLFVSLSLPTLTPSLSLSVSLSQSVSVSVSFRKKERERERERERDRKECPNPFLRTVFFPKDPRIQTDVTDNPIRPKRERLDAQFC